MEESPIRGSATDWTKSKYDPDEDYRQPIVRDGVLHGATRRHAEEVVDTYCAGEVLDLGGLLKREGRKALDPTLLDELGRVLEERSTKVRELRLRGWDGATDTALRSLALRVGPSFRVLDASDSAANTELLRVVPARFSGLTAVDMSGCVGLTDSGVQMIAIATHGTLTALDVSRCAKVSDDGIGWIAGQIGEPPRRCRRLLSLRASQCPRVRDRALWHIGRGLPQLQFLDLSKDELISDLGLEGLSRGSSNLRVLDLGSCNEITDQGIKYIAYKSPELRSLTLRRLEWLTDKSLFHIGHGCPKIQALDISGCFNLTEKGLYFVAQGCPGLTRVQSDGVDEISDKGLSALAKGRGRGVARLVSVGRGIEPTDEAPHVRLARQARMVMDSAALRIQCVWRAFLARSMARKLWERRVLSMVAQAAANRGLYWMELREEREGRMDRRRREAAFVVSKAARHWIQFRAARVRRRERAKQEKAAKVLDRLKARLRARRLRVNEYPEVKDVVMLVRQARRAEALAVAALRLQAGVRAWMSRRLVAPMVWERRQGRKLREEACHRIQTAWRAWMAREQTRARRSELMALARAAETLAREVQRVHRGALARRLARYRRQWALPIGRLIRIRSAIIMQCFWRCHLAYLELERRKAARRLLLSSAIRIQAVYRGSRVPRWRQLAVLRLRERTLSDRVQRERDADAARAARRRRLRASALDDSCEELESDDDWEPHVDDSSGWTGWWSSARQRYGDFPYGPPAWASERDLARLRARVKCYDEKAHVWAIGRLQRFVPTRRKFKILFDDGDAQWIDLHANHARIMLLWPLAGASQTWIPFRNVPLRLDASKQAGPYRKQDSLQTTAYKEAEEHAEYDDYSAYEYSQEYPHYDYYSEEKS